jgi:hypothetical protein
MVEALPLQKGPAKHTLRVEAHPCRWLDVSSMNKLHLFLTAFQLSQRPPTPTPCFRKAEILFHVGIGLNIFQYSTFFTFHLTSLLHKLNSMV